MSWIVEPIFRLPPPLFYVAVVVLGLWLLSFLQRMRAAAINDQSTYYDADGRTIRRFGMPPWNRYIFCGQYGWERISGYDYQARIYLTDGMDRTARLRNEIFRRDERRLYLIYPLVGMALDLFFLRLLILPAPFERLLHPLAGDNYLTLFINAMNNVLILLKYAFGPITNGWANLISVLVVFAFLIVFVVIAGRLFFHFQSVIGLAFYECLYLLGFQRMQGAKVFDGLPGERPRNPPVGLVDHFKRILNRFVLSTLHGFKNLRAAFANAKQSSQGPKQNANQEERTWADDKEREQTRQKEQARQEKAKQDEARYNNASFDPTRSVKDAYVFFEVTEHCTKKELLKKYISIVKRYNVDQQQDMPAAVRRQSEEIFKTANVAKDLIFSFREWR